MNFKAVLALSKTARSAQTHKSMSFIGIVWSTIYVYLWLKCNFDDWSKINLNVFYQGYERSQQKFWTILINCFKKKSYKIVLFIKGVLPIWYFWMIFGPWKMTLETRNLQNFVRDMKKVKDPFLIRCRCSWIWNWNLKSILVYTMYNYRKISPE